MLALWAATLPFAALFAIPWTYLTKDISFLYNTCMWAAWTGVRLACVKVKIVGLEKIDPARTYIFMSNHISNLDPPVTLPLIPRRTSVMVIIGVYFSLESRRTSLAVIFISSAMALMDMPVARQLCTIAFFSS